MDYNALILKITTEHLHKKKKNERSDGLSL